ncbi:crossover junction endodeoxyribonuclease RuvC [Microbacterium saccharophilum]|uniref:Crossover junction endodeoxyribonuclease RuvC n=1 Tax=Microbacterium saccharophilum TaxID=1213358 RepID=A0A5C8HUZ3_9MICO|nr:MULTISPECIES: crossover junction endodeoxyribonuclease RuvC [Microbacterium]TXK09078.1 crossover junction endodeoxyribonuclease RuvC [Microbacterium saccharophilum]GEP47759.1 crossover junction endodeoxyribonuclease RuvC [Microbacterium saccharophilum]SFI33269.1 Holliday junction endonuclease RuvC [Microbacterium saccharophilum]
MASTLRVLGIDPGLTRCGVGVVDVGRDRSATLVHVGVVRSDHTLPIERRLALIAAGIREVLDTHRPHVVAVERVFAQQNRNTVMGTAQASGIALLLAGEYGLPAATHTPSEVKAAVTGYGSADKRQVQTMVARVLRLDALPQPADAADALAIALCHAWRGGASGAASATGAAATALTPAQRAWADAERLARR